MALIVLDASVLISFSRRSDPFHDRAVRVLASPGVEHVAHPFTIAEYLVLPARSGQALGTSSV
jgi:predicted nucleic acid-binding protein